MHPVLLGVGVISSVGLWAWVVAARRNRRAKAARAVAGDVPVLPDNVSAPGAGGVAARPDKQDAEAGGVAARPGGTALPSRPSAAAHAPANVAYTPAASSTPSAGGIAARTDEPVATGQVSTPSAGGVAARTDEPVSTFEAGRSVATSPAAGGARDAELAEEAVEHSVSEVRVRPIKSRYRSSCPGWLGAVLNYGSMVQCFFTDYMVKHKHMSFDFDTVHTDNYSSFVHSEPVEYEIRTAPNSVGKLWCHVWKEPPPPCVGLISDNFVNWARDTRGPVAKRNWEGDRGIWFGWDCWGLWKVWPVIAALNHPQADFGTMLKGWGRHSRGIPLFDNQTVFPSHLLAFMRGMLEPEYNRDHWMKIHGELPAENAYLPTLPKVKDGKISHEITTSRERAAITTDSVANASWPNPDEVRNLHKRPIATFVASWNERLMSRGRWKDRFIVKDIRPLISDGTLPHTWKTPYDGNDWVEQIRYLNKAYNYLMNGRWIVWATLMYALAYYEGKSSQLPGWFVNHCSSWAVPVPRSDREARSVSKDGGLAIDKDAVPKHFHDSYDLQRLLEACAEACPMPGSVPTSKMQGGSLLNWSHKATGQYRPPAKWVGGWWSYQLSRDDVGTNWPDIIQGAVISVAASAASQALDSAVDVAMDAIDVALDELPEVVVDVAGKAADVAFSGFTKKITSQLIPFAGNFTKGFLEGFAFDSDLTALVETVSQSKFESFADTVKDLYSETGLENDPVAAYSYLREQLDSALGNANYLWGHLEALFGNEKILNSMCIGSKDTALLYRTARRFGGGNLY